MDLDLDPVEVGQRIKDARESIGMTQWELGDLVGVKERSIQNYEAGKKIPFPAMATIADLTGTSVVWLLYGTHSPPGAVSQDYLDTLSDRVTAIQMEVATIRTQLEAMRRLLEQLAASAPSTSRSQPGR